MPISLVDTTGQSLYVRFNDAGNRACAMTEGSGLKTDLYTASDVTIATTSLPAGDYIARVFVGTAGSQSSGDVVVSAGIPFSWDGSAETSAGGSGGLTSSEVAAAILDAAMGDHTDVGSVGLAIANAATQAGAGPMEQTPVADGFTVVLKSRSGTNLAQEVPRIYLQSVENVLMAIDFGALLHAGDALSEILALTEQDDQTITLQPIGVCGDLAKFRVSNVNETEYHVECQVTTLFGNVLEGDFILDSAD